MYKQNNIKIHGGSRQQSSLSYQQELQQKHQKKKGIYAKNKDTEHYEKVDSSCIKRDNKIC